jgi:putative DNA primase/helicase
MSNAPLPPIQFAALAEALLASADRLVPMWLPDGERRGHEYVCGSLSGGKGSSCSINLVNGRWADFASDEQGGDLLSLYAAIHGLSQAKAAIQVAREEGLESVAGLVKAAAGGTPPPPAPPRPAPAPKPAAEPEGWTTVRPVPANAATPTFKHFDRKPETLEHKATYRVGDELHGYVARFITSTGGKDTLPYTWCMSARDGAAKWHWRQWDEPRPLFLPSGALPGGRTVVLVEGERKAECLQQLLDASAPGVYCVVSWPGGCKVWAKADWSWLTGCTVMLWPDCDAKREAVPKDLKDHVVAQAMAQLESLGNITDKDRAKVREATLKLAAQAMPLLPEGKQPGMKAMLGIGALLRDTHGCTVQLLPIPAPGTVADGWDARDAIEADGWDFARVQAFFARAHALPDGEVAEPAAGKKIDGLVGTGSGGSGGGDAPGGGAALGGEDDDDTGMTRIGAYMVPDWLVPYYDKTNKRWLASRKMVILILERDPALKDVLAYNELSNNVQARTAWPWAYAKAGDVTDAVDLLLGKYLTDTYGLPSISRAALAEAIQTVAHTRRFHPIREMLQGLEWDGKSRIDNWLVHVLGESPDSLSKPMMEYLQIVGRCWLLGMVYRVMEPGCKFDYCPVLEGAGGLRKSTLVEALAGSEYFSDTPFEVGRGKEAQEQVQGLWLYEIAELTHFSKAEVGAIKAFISSKVDRYRVAYGATVGSFARQCLLVGTTNENTYLRDRTGNRRFWPIPVRHIINTEWLKKYREQLLAEAFALYGQGAVYTPTTDQERRLFVPMQESRLVETAVLSELLHVLTRAPTAAGIGAVVNELTEFVTIAQLTLALGVDAAKSTPALEGQIRSWLDHEGWERVKKQINGARAWGYTRPKDWPKADPDTGLENGLPPSPPPAPLAPPPAASPFTQEGDDAPF